MVFDQISIQVVTRIIWNRVILGLTELLTGNSSRWTFQAQGVYKLRALWCIIRGHESTKAVTYMRAEIRMYNLHIFDKKVCDHSFG